MYYTGTPFVKEKAIDPSKCPKTRIIYEDNSRNLDIAEMIIERKNEGKIDYIFYVNTKVSDNTLWLFHEHNYGSIDYFKEDFIAKNVVKQTALQQGMVISFKVTIYSDNWLELKEQIFNKNYELVEYHEFYYENGKETFHSEHIFYADKWLIHKEDYL